MSKIDILVRSILISLGLLSVSTLSASAQITATTGAESTGTTFATGVTPNMIDIKDGQKSSDNKNLFHSFSEFNVKSNQTANFISTPDIQNILGRVNGANGGSLIDGKLQVTGNANLFLMNPAGIVFGKGASLDINGAFTATTAKAIGFSNGQWFNALGGNNYSGLTGTPASLAFTGGTQGSIFSAADFYAPALDPDRRAPTPDPSTPKTTVNPGQNIRLVGGTVISTGNITTQGGNISISTVQGGKYVQIKSDGSIMSMNLPTDARNITSEATAFTPPALPALLTGSGVDLAANGIRIDGGVVKLIGDQSNIDASIARGDTISKQDRPILAGDVVTKNLNASFTDPASAAFLGTETDPYLENPGGKGGNVQIESSQAILTGDIITETQIAPDNLRTGGSVVLNAQTEIKTGNIDSTSPRNITPTRGGNVTLSTQTGDIIVNSIDTSAAISGSSTYKSRADIVGTVGGDLSVNASGLFRVITTSSEDIKGIDTGLFGRITIKHGSENFVSGVTFNVSDKSDPNSSTSTIKKPGFTFPNGASGSLGSIVTTRQSNGSSLVVYTDQGFQDLSRNGISLDGYSIIGKTDATPPKDRSNPDQQASRPKSKENCTPSSTSVASNPTAAPTRSAGNANAVSADPCQQNTSNNGILQILTDRN